MRRESHVRFCEGGGVRFPSATRLVTLAGDLSASGSARPGGARRPVLSDPLGRDLRGRQPRRMAQRLDARARHAGHSGTKNYPGRRLCAGSNTAALLAGRYQSRHRFGAHHGFCLLQCDVAGRLRRQSSRRRPKLCRNPDGHLQYRSDRAGNYRVAATGLILELTGSFNAVFYLTAAVYLIGLIGYLAWACGEQKL
jgi:hypothetical protein